VELSFGNHVFGIIPRACVYSEEGVSFHTPVLCTIPERIFSTRKTSLFTHIFYALYLEPDFLTEKVDFHHSFEDSTTPSGFPIANDGEKGGAHIVFSFSQATFCTFKLISFIVRGN
jgi:hypothetical protein